MKEKLPEGWVETTLGMLGEYINGYAFNDELWSKTGRPIIRIQDLTGTRNTPNYFDGEIDEKYLVRTGDFLIAWSATLGAFIWRGPEAWLNQHIFKAVSYIDKLFHYYLAQSVIDDLYQKAHGSGMVHVTRGVFESTKVPLPPLPEQHRIVASIEQQFTRLDNAVASLQSAQARIKQYRASLLRSAVEGELTTAWRAGHPIEETGEQLLKRILAERRARWEEAELAKMREKGVTPKDNKWKQEYKEPEGPTVDNLPELPEGWCWATVEQVITYLRNGLPQKPEASPPGYRILRINAVRPMKVDLDEVRYLSLPEEDARDYTINNGDILFTRYNGSLDLLGVAGVVRGCSEPTLHPDKLIRIKVVLKEVSPLYIEIACNVGNSRAFIESRARTTAGQKGISGSDIKQTPVPLPPLSEQEQIVVAVEASLSNIAKLEEAAENNLKRAEHERQSILQEAFAGRLVPQDPNDEPASVLLERIWEERKKREELEKVLKASRKGDRMSIAKRRTADRVAKGQQNVGLYEKLVEAGQPLSPDDLFKRVGLRTDEQPESVEAFYEELHADVTADLIEEDRPAADKVLLYVVEHEDANLEEDEETGEDDIIFVDEMRKAREKSLPNLNASKD